MSCEANELTDYRFSNRRTVKASFNIENQTLEVLSLWMVYIDWMVGRLVKLVQNTHLALGNGCSSEDRHTELILVDRLRATEGEENTALPYLLKRFLINLCIALERMLECILVLCKGWRVKDNEVVLTSHLVEILECIGRKSLVTIVTREVEFNISIDKIDCLGTAVYRVNNVCSATHCVDTESASITEHVQDVSTLSIVLEK